MAMAPDQTRLLRLLAEGGSLWLTYGDGFYEIADWRIPAKLWDAWEDDPIWVELTEVLSERAESLRIGITERGRAYLASLPSS